LGKLSALLPRKLRGLSSLVGMNVEIPEKKNLVITDYGRVCRKPCRRLVENSVHTGEFTTPNVPNLLFKGKER
jgi:hypothetical protein